MLGVTAALGLLSLGGLGAALLGGDGDGGVTAVVAEPVAETEETEPEPEDGSSSGSFSDIGAGPDDGGDEDGGVDGGLAPVVPNPPSGADEEASGGVVDITDEVTSPAATPSGDVIDIVDDTGTITVQVPAEWAEVDARPVEGGPNIQASPDLDEYRSSYGVGGMSFTLLQGGVGDPDDTIDFLSEGTGLTSACTEGERADYDDGVFVGRRAVFEDCAGVGAAVILVVASDGTNDVEISVQLGPEDTVDIYNQIQSSFNLVR